MILHKENVIYIPSHVLINTLDQALSDVIYLHDIPVEKFIVKNVW